ncbi:MAG: FmdB family zinc ribbon protein [Steroidobacteraceae bacterium]
MPFYEYQCRACGAQVEVLQKISDPPLKKCGECGKSQLQKLISAPSFRLAGGGWYETDFKTDKDKKRNLVEGEKGEVKSEDKADSKADAKADAKSDAKPDAKTEATPAPKADAKPATEPVKTAKRSTAKPAGKKARR